MFFPEKAFCFKFSIVLLIAFFSQSASGRKRKAEEAVVIT